MVHLLFGFLLKMIWTCFASSFKMSEIRQNSSVGKTWHSIRPSVQSFIHPSIHQSIQHQHSSIHPSSPEMKSCIFPCMSSQVSLGNKRRWQTAPHIDECGPPMKTPVGLLPPQSETRSWLPRNPEGDDWRPLKARSHFTMILALSR